MIFYQILSTNSLSKYIEISPEKLYVSGLKDLKNLLENGRKTSTSLTVCYAFRPKLERYGVDMLK